MLSVAQVKVNILKCGIKKLDDPISFMVIGAQKAGTTSLQAYLSQSTDILLAPDKEAPYFTDPDLKKRGWTRFLDERFKGSKGRICGTVTPQYMMYPCPIAEILSKCPSIKLVVLLREPITRAISDYNHRVAIGRERRSLFSAFSEQYNAGFEDLWRERGHEHNYLSRGLYGQILEPFFCAIPSERVHVLFSEDLKKNPEDCIQKLFGFLGARPPSRFMIQDKNSAGGKSFRRLHSGLASLVLAKGAHRALKLVLPDLTFRELTFWALTNYSRIGSVRQTASDIPRDLFRQLTALYSRDKIILEKITGVKVPW